MQQPLILAFRHCTFGILFSVSMVDPFTLFEFPVITDAAKLP